MPVTNIHKLYAEAREGWQEVRDCVAGNRAIKKAGTTYLPMLSGQSDDDYRRYTKKVKFFGATGRALDGLHGNIFRKAPEQANEISDTFTKSLEDVDLTGTNLEQFVSDLIYDCLQTNWGGILVDYARGEEAPSLAAADERGLKAYLKYYQAENFINWGYRVIGGKNKLNLAVLVEPYLEPDPADKFSSKEFTKYRVLYLDGKGLYTQDVYDSQISLQEPSERHEPKINGKRLEDIPFFTCPGIIPEKSMLYDLAQLNIQHYQDTADYNNGKHYTSIPTPIAIGLRPELDKDNNPKPVFIGGTKFQFFPNEDNVPGADVKFLEFTGAGMKTLAEGIQHIESQMSILGAHIIAAEKKGVETAEALRIHRIGENGVLAAFTRNISDQVTKAIRIKGLWDGESEEALAAWSINFNTDYDLSEENAATLSMLLTGRASGEIPRMSLYMGLKAIGLIPEQWDYDQFIEEAENDKEEVLPPMGIGQGNADMNNPDNSEPDNPDDAIPPDGEDDTDAEPEPKPGIKRDKGGKKKGA